MKNKKLWIGLIAATVIVVSSFVFVPVAKSVESSWTVFYEVLDIIHREYVEKNVDTTKLIYGAIRGMLASLDDPYSRFMAPKAFEETKIHMKGQFYGVGIQIGIKNEILTVIAPIEGTPAYKAGIKSLDKIAEIDGVSTDGMSLEEAVSKIRGDKGTPVVLGIVREGVKDMLKISIIRDAIQLKSVTKSKMLTDKIGYIQLVTFESNTATKEMEDALKQLAAEKGFSALILDLRNNGGGLLSNAIKMASIFLKDGVVVQTVDRELNREVMAVLPGSVHNDKPLVILINEASASASEILAGAIQDHKRGVIVGRHSFGKASVQNIRPLGDGSAILITIAKYQTPNGFDISKKGIIPDVESQFTTEDIKVMSDPNYTYQEKDDRQLQKAIDIANELLTKGKFVL